jgi:hypothetical protein
LVCTCSYSGSGGRAQDFETNLCNIVKPCLKIRRGSGGGYRKEGEREREGKEKIEAPCPVFPGTGQLGVL